MNYDPFFKGLYQPDSLPKSEVLSEMSEYFFFFPDDFFSFFVVSISLGTDSIELMLELLRDFLDFLAFFLRLRE
jgi:hypothetical protein